jgi:hypothetical protein
MHGNDVVTIDGDKIGHVVDERDGYLIVEHGLLKTKHAIPQKCVEEDAESGVLRTTLSKSLVHDSPKVNGHFDSEAIAEHYGLAEGFDDPPTRGLGVLEPDDPAFTDERSLQERVRAAREVSSGEGAYDGAQSSPGVTGGDRARDYPKDPPRA